MNDTTKPITKDGTPTGDAKLAKVQDNAPGPKGGTFGNGNAAKRNAKGQP